MEVEYHTNGNYFIYLAKLTESIRKASVFFSDNGWEICSHLSLWNLQMLDAFTLSMYIQLGRNKREISNAFWVMN